MLIYDVGMAEGDDTAYYLAKGARVIGIEANKAVCDIVREKFRSAVESSQLCILNVAAGAEEADAVEFFINDKHLRGSSLARPINPSARSVPVRMRRLSGLFDEYGEPDFVKIDVEHVDHIIIRELWTSGRIPRHLSVEAHGFSVIEELIRCEYSKLRLVNAAISHRKFRNHPVRTPNGATSYSFPPHSSGPFGDDLPEPWLNSEKLVAHWLLRSTLYGRGWYDIHAMK
jgi:FkbM family methyltransferase